MTISVSRAVCRVVVRDGVEGTGVIFGLMDYWVDLDKMGRLDWRVKRNISFQDL